MKIESGSTNKYVNFVAVDATDLKSRETGLSSFTVYRSRNGATPVAMTTPTIVELSSANMPGVYALLADEDTTIDSGQDFQEMVFQITHTGMAPVTRSVVLERPKITLGNSLDVTSGGNGGIDLDNISLTNGSPLVGIHASGTLSGTHNSTSADLGTNAPSTDISGMVLYIPSRGFIRLIDSYSTGTGVASFESTAETLTNGDPWILFATPMASTENPIHANIIKVNNVTIGGNGTTLDPFGPA